MQNSREEIAGNSQLEEGKSSHQGFSRLGLWRDVLLVISITITGLYFARDFFIPLSIALLLFVLLIALIDRISQIKIFGKSMPVWLTHVLGILVIAVGFAGIFSILSVQANDVVAAAPRYEKRFAVIVAEIVSAIGSENAEAIRELIADTNISQYVAKSLGSVSAVFSSFLLVALYLPFMVSERTLTRNKIRLAAPDDQVGARIDGVLGGIASSLKDYVMIKTMVSLLTGVLSYAIMRAVGLDFAETWAILIFLLNFIPTIGSILSVLLISIAALVQFETFTPFLVVAIGCGLVQFVVGSILEPMMTGKSLNLSPMMVLLALTLWSSLWGLSGAFLSVPITVCVLIVLSNIPNTRWIAILMSGDGTLITDRK